MSTFHRQRLLSSIRESNQVPVQADWAFAIRKQARLILVPLFRQIIVDWYAEGGVKFPRISALAEDLYWGLMRNGELPKESEIKARGIVKRFVSELKASDKAILKFYFWTSEKEIDELFQSQISSTISDSNSLEEDQVAVGKSFLENLSKLTDEQLLEQVLNELKELENIVSGDEVKKGFDVDSVIRINENFSDYLDMPYGEVTLVQVPGDEWDYWVRVYEEERKTIGKKLAHDKHKEWLECWPLPDGDFKVKGDLDFPEDSDYAAKTWILEELQDILVQLETRLIENYSLEDQNIKYTFFTKRGNLKNCDLISGIAFFADQIEHHGAYDFQPGINFYLVLEVQKDHQIWDAQTTFDFDKRLFDLEDQIEPVSAWVVSIEEMIFQLEAQLSMMEKEKVIEALFSKINEDYLKQYGD
jgi:hypothetical protein